ncbi:MAG: hypothetical protein ACHQ49_16000 [Elusimicrobiota bacterium]
MITALGAVLLCSAALAAPAPASAAPAPASAAPAPAPAAATSAVHSSGAPAAPSALTVSTFTVSTLYTGDQVRDPFLPASFREAARPSDRAEAPVGVDIHALELRGIMKDAASSFAIFSTDNGATLILRANKLYDEHNKRVPGITGRIMLKQKRAELVTPDKDVQIFTLGEMDADKAKGDQSDETGETGSGRGQ